MPKLSIIVPINYAEQYLHECLDSLGNQTLEDIEFILVNDESTDQAKLIAEEYVLQFPQKFKLINNDKKGVSSARNRGLQVAKGEYIGFLDPDDFVLPNTYKVMYENSKMYDTDTFIGNIKCFNDSKTWGIPYFEKVFDKNLPKIRHVKSNPELMLSTSVCNKLFKRDLIVNHNLQFDEKLSIGEDYTFTKKALYLSNKTCVMDINSLNYRAPREFPKLSIIVPIYNAEAYLRECLESLCNQTLKEMEFILINDGSTDHSLTIAEEFVLMSPNKFRLINQQNSGVANARNNGIRVAKGEYIGFLDPDDFVLPNTYKVMYQSAKENDSDTFIGNIKCFNETRTWGIPYMAEIFDKRLPEIRHIKRNSELNLTPSVCNKIFKRELLLSNNIHFDEDLKIGEDFLFSQQALYLSNKTSVKDINSLNYRVFQSQASLSKRNDVQFFEGLLKNIQKLNTFYRENNLIDNCHRAEERQWKFFIDSILIRSENMGTNQLEEVYKIAKVFHSFLLNDFSITTLYKNKFNAFEFLTHDFVVNNEFDSFMKLLEIRNNKKVKRNKVITKEKRIYNFLVKYFPTYRRFLEEEINLKNIKPVIKLEEFSIVGGILTIGGYIFYPGFKSNKYDKRLLVFREVKTKKEITINLTNQLRTDVSNLNGQGIYDYDYCGIETVNANLSEIGLFDGVWEIILVTKNAEFSTLKLESKISSRIIENQNSAKRNIVNATEIVTLFNRKILTIRFSKLKGWKLVRQKLVNSKINIKNIYNLNKQGSYKEIIVLLYFAVFGQYYKRRDIWFVGERHDTAQDNSFHLFKYIRENHRKIRCYYVIDKDSKDYHNVKDFKNVIHHGSLKHTFYLLIASKVINSYSEKVFMYTKEYKRIIEVYPNLHQFAKRIFLQHGVIGVSRVNHVLHKNKNNYNLFVVSSKGEQNHIVKEYGFKKKEVVLTGLARWDNLTKENTINNEILIMPTWRAWIKNKEDLLNSDYFNRYTSLLKNEKFNVLLKEKNIKVNFYLHYEMQEILDTVGNELHFDNPNINIIKFGDNDVQNLLKENALLITDYSTVSFDFAYMQKPVIFYQFDYNLFFTKHYREGIINHKRDLFGDVLDDEEKILNKIEYYINNKMMMEKKFVNKTHKFVIKNEGSHSKDIFLKIADL